MIETGIVYKANGEKQEIEVPRAIDIFHGELRRRVWNLGPETKLKSFVYERDGVYYVLFTNPGAHRRGQPRNDQAMQLPFRKGRFYPVRDIAGDAVEFPLTVLDE